MRVAGKVAADTLDHIASFIRTGITTKDLDAEVEAFIRKTGCVPAFKGYKDFPASACISVNGEVVHCIPSDYKLEDGDVLKIDLGAKHEGFCSDTAKTFLVGDVEPRLKRLAEVGYEALLAGIKKAVVGNHVADISNTVYEIIRRNRYGAVKEYMGHGIGKEIHEMPHIPNTKLDNPGPELKAGMVICIEPILTLNPSGKVKPRNAEDKWGVLTLDGCKAVHWEHTVAITENGPEILTLRKSEQYEI